jgi:beta-lactamase class A
MNPTRRNCLLLFGAALSASARDDVPKEWRRAAEGTDGVVGAAALHLTSKRGLSMNGGDRFPLASVCKLPIAMNILALVDEGEFALADPIEVLPRDVWAGVSNIAPRWPVQRRFPLTELLEQMVAKSDNTAVETLFRIGGGGAAMAARFRKWNVHGVRLDRSERHCDLDRNGVVRYPPPDRWTDATINTLIAEVPPATQYQAVRSYLKDPRDTGTPDGTVQLLGRAVRGEVLSKSSTARLVEILKATTTSPTRIKGLLPPGTVVAHKTGTTGTVNGLTAATNDSGVIFLPDGSQLAVSVYVKASTRSASQRDSVIARIARAAFDYYS